MFKHKFHLIMGSVAFIASGALYGTFAMDDSDQNTPPSTEDGTSNTVTNEQKKKVEEDMESASQKMYNMTLKGIPEELLVAVLVQLKPSKLYIASMINSLWRRIALRIMEDNLVKVGVFQPNSKPEAQEVLLAYQNYFAICPDIDNFDEFLTSMDKGEKVYADPNNPLSYQKIKFNYNDKVWFIDHSMNRSSYDQLRTRRSSISNFGAYVLGPQMIDTTIIEGPEFIKNEVVTGDPERVRCYYNVKIKENYYGDIKELQNIDFYITTVIKKNTNG